ncbi:MAG: hypothetical protein GF418_13610 [Chitinivibrionales bacterium]|nr:hypothetical protein [Chitinivibrionales bacterium]MBD3396657.1 hypothetical protein [Chitinivibrionales bacterium]
MNGRLFYSALLVFCLHAGAAELELMGATYLGGAGADEAAAVDIAPDRTIVYAGVMAGALDGQAETSFLGGGNGILIRFNSSGTQVLSVARFPDRIDDMEIDRAGGNIATIGAFGTVVLSADASAAIWSADALGTGSGGSTLGPGRRVSIGARGTVAALFGKSFAVYDNSGTELGTGSMPHGHVNDVAVHDEHRRVFIAGFDQRNTCGNPVQVAVVKAFDFDGTEVWKRFGFEATSANFCGDYGNQMADTRGMLVTVGRDGDLYFAGESAGGNSIFRYNGEDLATATLIHYDAFTHAYNTSSNHITYYARMDPSTGTVKMGQLVLPRLSSGKGNTIRPTALGADEDGNVYVAGTTTFHIDSTGLPTIDGGDVAHAGGFVLISRSDFMARLLWTTFEKEAYSSTAYGVACGKGLSAVASTVTKDRMYTANALQASGGPASEDNPDGYLAVWEGHTPAATRFEQRCPVPGRRPGSNAAFELYDLRGRRANVWHHPAGVFCAKTSQGRTRLLPLHLAAF